MKRYQRWMATLGLIALTPAVMLPHCDAGSRKTVRRPAAVDQGQENFQRNSGGSASDAEKAKNQRMAISVATALRKAKLGNEDFDVQYQNGVVSLVGPVSSERNKQIAERVAKKVPGVDQVQNGLVVGGRPSTPAAPSQMPPNQVIPAQGTVPANAPRGGVQQTGMLIGGGNEPIQAPPGDGNENLQPIPGGQMIPAGQYQQAGSQQMPAGFPSVGPPGYVPTSVPAPPGQASGGNYPGGYPFAPAYDQPNLPNYAWPTYASYPNYAQVSYPKQYSASAYPYIGPFHPYPQVPLGWRKVQLEWDDGYWQINFRPRTEKWWWFMNPGNWN